jgi:hypothetical protein
MLKQALKYAEGDENLDEAAEYFSHQAANAP